MGNGVATWTRIRECARFRRFLTLNSLSFSLSCRKRVKRMELSALYLASYMIVSDCFVVTYHSSTPYYNTGFVCCVERSILNFECFKTPILIPGASLLALCAAWRENNDNIVPAPSPAKARRPMFPPRLNSLLNGSLLLLRRVAESYLFETMGSHKRPRHKTRNLDHGFCCFWSLSLFSQQDHSFRTNSRNIAASSKGTC
jgi:hypothetical protein